jgi:hypothetical protein
MAEVMVGERFAFMASDARFGLAGRYEYCNEIAFFAWPFFSEGIGNKLETGDS